MPPGSASGSSDEDDAIGERGTPQDCPGRLSLPRWAAPLPARIEAIALRWVWVIVAINLLGTAFGFWYYRFQLQQIDPQWWVFVPDSPVATLFIALALAAWAIGRPNDTLASLAFIGNIKLGLWTPYVLVAFAPGFLEYTAIPMYLFLFWSHLAMAVQAFVLHRISGFPLYAIAIAATWYTVDLLFDYFVPLGGQVTHTAVPYAGSTPWFTTTVLQVAAAGAVVLTIAPIAWVLATRVRIVAAGGQPWE